MKKKKILLINGPNMQLLGQRETDIYGAQSLEELESMMQKQAAGLGLLLECFQNNSEGAIVDKIGDAPGAGIDAVIINPAAYSHSSIAIHDALKGVNLPTIEVHVSNVCSREEFRRNLVTAPACSGMIAGLGLDGYFLALRAISKILQK